ncbi:MAG: LssY C-terminal domain-containing protein, partial [Microbacteriaceae bacterium]
FAYQQEVDGNPAQRHHVRFWRCPEGWLLPGGRQVDWVAAGTFDTSVGLSLFTLQVTHRIDADTDVERDHIVATVTAADPRVSVDVIADFSTGYHARNGGGDSIRTDGDLPIVDVRAVEAVTP